MIPLRLSIEGVHSYQKKQEIDFEHLTAAGLFGIFGKVGSGKSTILEAITVVLYGQNDRFSKPERSYNLTNLRSNHFNISFDFMIEANQFKYRFEMTGTRNSKKFEDITVKRAAYQWQIESNTWMPIADINAERILDLKYNDFKRTIIIPQGKFQEFLEMNATERTAMMQHLFKLDKYDLADKTTNLISSNNLAISSLEGELLSLGTASPEEFTAKTKDLHQATTLLQTYETETKQLREHALAEETLKKLFDDLFKATQQLEKLDAQQGFFEKREKELHDFQAALLHIKPILDKQSERLTEQKTTSRELVNVQQNLQKITLDFDHSANSYNTLRPQYEQRDKLKIQEKELNKILNINELVAEIEKNRAKIKLDKEKLATLKLTIDKDKQERIDCQIQLEKDQAQMPNSERLLAVQSWFDTHKKLKDDKANIMAEAHKVKHEESELNTQKTKWLDTELIAADSIQTDSNLAQIEVVFENQRQVFLSKAEQLDSQKIKLQTRLAIQAHAATLTDGQPCPMCGSVHHPEPLSDDQDLKKDIKTIENQQVEFKKNAESLSKIVNEIGKIAAKFEGLNKQKEDIRVRYNLTVANLTQHESEFIWEDFQKENPQGIAEAFQQINILKAQIDNQQKRIKTLEQSIAQAETKQRDEFELPLERLSTTTENKAEEQQKLRAEITLFDYETEANQGLETLNKKIQNLDYQYIEVEKQYLSIEIKYNKLKAETQTEAARLGMLQTADSKHKLALEAITLELTTALAQTHFENLTNAQLILTKNLVLASEQKAISDFKADFAQAQKQYLSLREQSKEHVFEENKLLEINKLISENEKAMKAFIQQQGALKNELESIEKDLAKQADLYKKKDALNLRAADLKTLQEMFRANGFVNFISTVYLQNLCNHADERFHLMTRQQLRLELSDKNEFMIRDLLNGGKTRSASSLSGGQKFQASLALALALADSIQKSGQKNFFFLDEGFGSLDKEALKIVFETLKSLRKENRIVGLISHVEELQHEMDRCLHINNDEQLGSLVSVF